MTGVAGISVDGNVTPSLGPVVLTGTAGGNGGSAFALACPGGRYMSGVNGRVGNGGAGLVDQIQVRCTLFSDRTTLALTSTVGQNLGGSIAFTLTCPADASVAGILGRAGNLIDRIGLRCRR